MTDPAQEGDAVEERRSALIRLLDAQAATAMHEQPPDWQTFHVCCDLINAVEARPLLDKALEAIDQLGTRSGLFGIRQAKQIASRIRSQLQTDS